MNTINFPIEFNNELDDIKKSENKPFLQAADRLHKLAESHNDISGGMINFKQPSKGHQTEYTHEVTIVVYMGSDHIAATEKGEAIQATLNGALSAVEYQVREFRKQQRNY